MFTAVDVYDAASSIGRDCQLIISEHGPEVLQELLPKVVSVLEELESCAVYCESEGDEIQRLQCIVNDLRSDCRSELYLKENCDENLEKLEQSWYNETQRLLQQVTTLEAENSSLAQQLTSQAALDTCKDNCSQVSEQKAPGGSIASVVRSMGTGRQPVKHLQLGLPDRSPTISSHLLMSSAEELAVAMTGLLAETEERLHLTDQENRAADLQLIGRLKERVSGNHKLIRNVGLELLRVNTAIDAAETEVCRLARQSGQLMASRVDHRPLLEQLLAEKVKLENRLSHCQQQLRQKTASLSEDAMSIDPITNSALECLNHISPVEGVESCAVGRPPSDNGDNDSVVSLEVLRQLVCERNEIRCRLIELEIELKALKLQSSREPDVEGPILQEPPEKLYPNRKPPEPIIKSIFRQLLRRLTEEKEGNESSCA